MSRLLPLLAATLSISACAASPVTPGTLPPEASSAAYTTATVTNVASCIAAAIGGTAQNIGDHTIVQAAAYPGLKYDISLNDRKDSVYPTQIAVIGSERILQDRRGVDTCLVSNDLVR